jgi:hypothetical protein
MKLQFSCCLLLLLVAVISCKTENTTAPISHPITQQDTRRIVPLATGNFWNYDWTIADTVGRTLRRDTATLSVFGPDTLGAAYEYYLSNEKSIYLFFLPSGVFENKDGLYAPTPYPPPDSTRAIVYPTVPGDSCVYDHYIRKTISINEVITVPAGTFSCVEYDLYIVSPYVLCQKMWCAPGVGIVKITLPVEYDTYDYELINYTLF